MMPPTFHKGIHVKVRELLCDKSKWTTGQFAAGSDGMPRYTTSEQAARWCLIGAIYKCYGTCDGCSEAMAKVDRYLVDHLNYRGGPAAFNAAAFNDTHTWEDINKLITELDI